ncbi:MAG: GNAT family N-acetyltransferase [Gemmatimonadetes bacterium]|nr:GNAT family N-acetyltransferase [Gemmatimonadota bacterium]
MWRPERAAHGPLPVTDRDIASMNRLFSDSFTDRYRRDGLVGVRVPFLNEAIWRYAIADAGDGAMLWRDEAEKLVAFNVAHVSGAEGWMGPLCVRPDRQLSGLGKEIVTTAVDWLKSHGATTIGLETMPRTVDNIGFYSRLGFVPGSLTLTMTIETVARVRREDEALRLSHLDPAQRAGRLTDIGRLVEDLAPGYDFGREIELTLDLCLGDVVTVEQKGALAAFALCHATPLAEGGGRDEVRVLKVAAVDDQGLLAVLGAASQWAHRCGGRRLAIRCQSAYGDLYQALIGRGYRVRWSDLRMTLGGYPERRPARGVLWSNWEI